MGKGLERRQGGHVWGKRTGGQQGPKERKGNTALGAQVKSVVVHVFVYYLRHRVWSMALCMQGDGLQ